MCWGILQPPLMRNQRATEFNYNQTVKKTRNGERFASYLFLRLLLLLLSGFFWSPKIFIVLGSITCSVSLLWSAPEWKSWLCTVWFVLGSHQPITSQPGLVNKGHMDSQAAHLLDRVLATCRQVREGLNSSSANLSIYHSHLLSLEF